MPDPAFCVDTSFENASPLNWVHAPDGGIVIDLVYDHERGTRNRQAAHWHFLVCGPAGRPQPLPLRCRRMPVNIFRYSERPGSRTAPYLTRRHARERRGQIGRWEGSLGRCASASGGSPPLRAGRRP
jgi:hypothetical protein